MTNTIKILFKKKAILFLMLLCFTSALTAAQTTKLSLNVKQTSLRNLFTTIESKTDLLFFYIDADIANLTVDINTKDKEVNEILDLALSNTNLKYNIDGRNVNIYKEQSPQQANTKRRITGRVTDVKGEPLIGVSVVESGTTNGTITDIDGLYELQVETRNAQIVLSYVGFRSATVNIGGSSVYDVALQEAVNELDELVVVGYGQQRKISSIGSQSTLKQIDLKTPTASLTTVLSGRLAGVVAVQRTGEPGRDAADIWIRGLSTPNAANPLILVDGVERSFNDLDPEDVESVTVLKDASATAVFGVRGANGVIVVKTKPGIIGKPVVSIDYYEGFTRFTKSPQVADGLVYMDVVNEGLRNTGKAHKYDDQYIANTASGVDKLLYPNVDWKKEVFNDWGHARRVNANIRGGSPMAQFYTSVSYYNEKGTIKTDPLEDYNSKTEYTRYNIVANLSMKITETTTVDVGTQGFLGDGNSPGEDSGTIFGSTVDVNPVIFPKMFVINGKNYVPGLHSQGADRNPYADATMRGYRNKMDNKVQSNIKVTQDLSIITEGLKAVALFAYDVSNSRDAWFRKRENTYYFADRNNPYDADGNPILTRTWDNGSSVLGFDGSDDRKLTGERKDNFEVSLVYDKAIKNHRFGAMAIYTQQNRIDNSARNAIDYLPYRIQGIASRVTYSWNDRYFGEFNIGYNGGENFPKDRRYGTFPAFGVGWVASNEPFWKPLSDIIPFFKVRYTNGKVGNSNVRDRRFMYMEQYEWNGDWGYGYGGNGRKDGVKVKNPATSLGWEVAHKQDLGFDIQLFKSSLSISIDLFKERRTNILLNRDNSLPGFAGFQETPYGNVGETKTLGYDANFEYNKKINKDWNISVRGNITYADPTWVDNDIPDKSFSWRNRKGSSLVSIEGFTADRLYTQADIDLINQWIANPGGMEQPFPTPYKVGLSQVRAGDIKYKDLDGDGKIDDNDISWLGQGDIPKLNYGFGFNVDYKAVSFGVLFQGTAKANRFVSGIVKPLNGSGTANVYSNIYDRWTEENQSQDVFYPRLAFGGDEPGNQNNFENSTWWLKDMSFLRLKTLQLAYRLPESWTRKANLKNASIYMMGMNIFTLSKWKLWDPELNTDSGNRYPNTTTVTLGINFSF
ncbi:SusC/RagA family TonB-linked outer membrane protein [Dysgonomonas sp. ZJ279]|uniref:SusC/RagA family TonB-linked outer membrane protein n=1 Tax=Dysgonomonas sp. ZJ279 TaxID=2709796 RepID=UPI0021043D31|nr:SusC/RagA family TonB-linked outer membrane protein [Dysgonomonas sp. ZJ279]